jgi:hypothetical protein
MAKSSSDLAYGMGTSAPATRSTGASKKSKASVKNEMNKSSTHMTERHTFRNYGGKLSSNSRLRPALLDCYNSVCLFHRGNNCFHIQRTYRTKVDNLLETSTILFCDSHLHVSYLSTDSFSFQFFGSFQAVSDNSRKSYQSDVLALTLHLGLANGDQIIFGLGFWAERKLLVIEQLTLEENDGVAITSSCLQQTTMVLCRPRGNDLESWNVAVPGGKAL